MTRKGRLSVGIGLGALVIAAALWPRAPQPAALRKAARTVAPRIERIDQAPTHGPDRKLRCGDIECNARTQRCCAGYLAVDGAFGTACAPSAGGCPPRGLPMNCWSGGDCAATATACCFGAEGARCATECEPGEQALGGVGPSGDPVGGKRLARRLRLPFPSRPVPLESALMATTREK
jgi:hypothetical protein